MQSYIVESWCEMFDLYYLDFSSMIIVAHVVQIGLEAELHHFCNTVQQQTVLLCFLMHTH